MVLARTYLFVPGDRPDRFAKALASGADAVVLDLEDAVLPTAKAAARAAISAFLATTAQTSRVVVRINASGTPWFAEDLAALAGHPNAAVMLPKAETPHDIATVRAQCRGAAVLALVESAAGVIAAESLAAAPKTWGNNAYANVAEQRAALGFVAIIVDGPGTPCRPCAFQLDACGRIESCGGLPDHVNAIRHLAATRPWMDLDRVGIVGGSGGGNATVRAMGTFPDFYKVGVAMCGNHDQAAYIAAWGERYQGLYDETLYATQANKTVASQITGDLLLIHGDLDNNVHPAMTMQVVDALIKADRNFDLLIVPNAGHMLILLPYVQRRLFDYFVERLMGEAAPRPQPRPL
jgi:dienelactone hydrolase